MRNVVQDVTNTFRLSHNALRYHHMELRATLLCPALPPQAPPNAKVVESLATGAKQLGACASNGHDPAAAGTVNERIKRRAACTEGPASGPAQGYMEIIEADPVGCEQLAVPASACTQHTASGRAYPPQLGAPLPAANDARVATLLSMGHVDQPPCPRIGEGKSHHHPWGTAPRLSVPNSTRAHACCKCMLDHCGRAATCTCGPRRAVPVRQPFLWSGHAWVPGR